MFYRLSVIPIHLPPLRERRDDIPLLARSFLERFRKSMEKPIEGISPEAMSLLESYDWPGNVRELENTMERSVALETGEDDFRRCPAAKRSAGEGRTAPGNMRLERNQRPREQFPKAGSTSKSTCRIWRRTTFVAALEACDGVGTRAAELLKMSYRSFRHYSKKYNIT